MSVGSAAPVVQSCELQLHSAYWLNLHHVLYAAAWAGRGVTRRPGAEALPAQVDLPRSAVAWYELHVADRDLLFDEGLQELHWHLAEDDLASIPAEHREVLTAAAASYDSYWPEHDAANRAWAVHAAGQLETLAAQALPALSAWFTETWPGPDTAVRVDVVWVCNAQGAYTTLHPTHVIASGSNPRHQGDSSAEILCHEVAHALIGPIARRLESARDGLWHAVLFHLVGEAVRRAYAYRGTTYEPYLYRTGLIDRAWPRYRNLLATTWTAYANGDISLDDAITASIRT